MAIYMTARFRVRPGGRDKCEQAIREFVDHIRANEPGTLFYVSLRDNDDSVNYLHLFEFADESARNIHRNSDAVKRFTSVLYPETVDGVQFHEHTLVSTNRD